MADVIILGAGPAGLTAAIYVQRAGLTAQVFEGAVPGGQIVNAGVVENYPGIKQIEGYKLASNMLNQASELGAEFVYSKAEKIEETNDGFAVTAAGKTYEAKALILATGLTRRKLGLPNEEKLTGKGVSYCATCDGAFFRGKAVAVNGGGNTALEDAEYLAGLAKTVYLIHRRDAFRADEAEIQKTLAHDNVIPVYNSTISSLNEGGDGRLSGVTVKDKVTGQEKTLDVSGLFVAIGQIPQNEAYEGLVELDPQGFIAAGEDCKTSHAGIFAAGDCRHKTTRQLTTAAGDGAVAGNAAAAFVKAAR